VAFVANLIVAIADDVTKSIDNSSSPERYPEHVAKPHDRSDPEPKDQKIDEQEHDESEHLVWNEQSAFDEIVGAALRELLHCLLILIRIAIISHAEEQDLKPAVNDR